MGKIYVITGSTSGIGKELVKTFASNPDNTVFAGYRNRSKIDNSLPQNVVHFYIDMTQRESIKQAADFIKSKTNKIDTLVNVAGCVIAGPIEYIDTQRLRNQFDVNTFSHIEFTQNLTDILTNGKIINISSMASFGNFPFISPYCASKRALDIFFNAFALENHSNIKVVSVKPGVIGTPLWEKSVELNIESLNSCEKYSKELEFIKSNALKNATRGLTLPQVVKLIEKIDSAKNPKSSYTIGIDAKIAEVLSVFPPDFVNKIIKFGMKLRFK